MYASNHPTYAVDPTGLGSWNVGWNDSYAAPITSYNVTLNDYSSTNYTSYTASSNLSTAPAATSNNMINSGGLGLSSSSSNDWLSQTISSNIFMPSSPSVTGGISLGLPSNSDYQFDFGSSASSQLSNLFASDYRGTDSLYQQSMQSFATTPLSTGYSYTPSFSASDIYRQADAVVAQMGYGGSTFSGISGWDYAKEYVSQLYWESGVDLYQAGASVVNAASHPIQTYNQAVDNTAAIIYRNQAMNNPGSFSTFQGVLDGSGHVLGSLTGIETGLEAMVGVDHLTGQDLGTTQRWQRGFVAVSQLATTASMTVGTYASAQNQIALQTMEMSSFQLGGYGAIRINAILGTATSREIGMAGEYLGGLQLSKQGLTNLTQIKNASGHGIDWVGQNAAGNWVFNEVKASAGLTAKGLSPAQQNINKFVPSRVNSAIKAQGAWQNVQPSVQVTARDIRASLQPNAPIQGGNVINVTNLGGFKPQVTVRPW